MNTKKIVIIDDDPRNIFALSAILKAKKFECITFTDAWDAINFLKEEEIIDAILIDMMMPGIDGYEAIPIIKTLENRKKTPILAVTALAMVGDKEKCLKAGADYYVSKPINIDFLLDILNSISQ